MDSNPYSTEGSLDQLAITVTTAKSMMLSPAGPVVRYHRERAGLTRKELSTLSGVGQTAIYDVEHGKPTVRLATVLRLLDVLNVRMRFESPLMAEFESGAGS